MRIGAVLRPIALGLTAALLVSCASLRKGPPLEKMRGKMIAVSGFRGSKDAERAVEGAIVNQVLERGTFLLTPRGEIRAARRALKAKPWDPLAIAIRVNADYALWGDVLAFESEQKEGYVKQRIYENQLAAKNEDKTQSTEKLIKVKSIEGHVMLRIFFQDLISGETWSGVAEEKEKIEQGERRSAVYLPPRLRFLEELTNRAVNRFFEQHHQP